MQFQALAQLPNFVFLANLALPLPFAATLLSGFRSRMRTTTPAIHTSFLITPGLTISPGSNTDMICGTGGHRDCMQEADPKNDFQDRPAPQCNQQRVRRTTSHANLEPKWLRSDVQDGKPIKHFFCFCYFAFCC